MKAKDPWPSGFTVVRYGPLPTQAFSENKSSLYLLAEQQQSGVTSTWGPRETLTNKIILHKQCQNKEVKTEETVYLPLCTQSNANHHSATEAYSCLL